MTKKDLQKVLKEFLLKSKSSLITEETLTQAQLEKRQDYLKDLMKQKHNLVQRYKGEAEKVAYGRATNMAKKAVSEMNKQKLKELVKSSLMKNEVEENKVFGPGENPFEGYVTAEQKIVAKAFMVDPTRTEFDYKDNAVVFPDPIRIELVKGGEAMLKTVKMGNRLGFVKGYYDEDGNEIPGAYIKIPSKHPMGEDKEVKEDIEIGHTDNEPHMIKAELYQIGKYAMELYSWLEEMEETSGEYDFPAWWQAKITSAKDNISGAKHYIEFELNEPKIDAMVDAATGEEPHMGEPEAPMMEAEGTLNQVRNELLGLFQPFGDFQILDMTMKGQNTGTEFRLYSKSKGANWKGLENFMRNNPDFTIKHISKQTFDNPKAIDFSYKKSPMMEEEIGKDEELAGRLYKMKNFVQPAFFQKIRSLINSGDLETAEFFIKRMEPAAAKNDLEMAKMKGDLEDIDAVVAQRKREKQFANVFAETISKKLKETSYPWDKCIADRKEEGKSEEEANKICGSIKAANNEGLEEKKLTTAEKNKKEEIVKSLKKSGMKKGPKMYAIATAKAEKVAENIVKKLKND